ncbi:MAG TPA: DUF1614 domain-containing protein [Nitrospira sp.]|nr:DUF1614 domain-containing protein [Nitrospira sp.]
MKIPAVIPLLLFLILLAMLPFIFGQLFASALIKLKLEPTTALLVVLGIFLGSAINIPVKRIPRTESTFADPLAVFGLAGRWPSTIHVRRETLVAVNVGGCLIPVGLAVYEIGNLILEDGHAVLGLVLAVVINVFVCYWMAEPVEGIGIAMPGLLPALIAAMSALLLAPDQAAPVAFVAGVLGPLIGADLFHLRDISKIATGIASIGGAGTFDGIVLSGIVAAYLA